MLLIVLACLVTIVTGMEIVPTSSGLLQGDVVVTPYGSVRRYLGVPYGIIPERFSSPREIDERNTPRSVKEYGPSCVQAPHAVDVMYSQLTLREQIKTVSEDCLYLNVFAAQRSDSPVMVWFPGEGYDFADANQFDGSILAARGNVTVVTVNYRVGPFGFLTTNDGIASTNNGIRDILLALKWIQNNIKKLGGDPDNVTVFGRFTGAASLSIVLASPHFKNSPMSLAKKFILQSGIATGPYIFEDDPQQALGLLADKVNCSSTMDCEEVVDCLRKVPYETLMAASLTVAQRWRPVIDHDILIADPLEVIAGGNYRKDVSVILGHNEDEGSLCLLTHFYLNTPHHSRILKNALTKTDLRQLVTDHIRDYLKEDNDAIVETALHEYGYAMADKSYRDQYMQFCGHMYIKAKTDYLTEQLARHGTQVYAYQFSHRPTVSIHPDFLTAAHGDEVLYVFGLIDEPNQIDFNVTDAVVSLWTNFAKTGNPNGIDGDSPVTWSQYKYLSPEYLSISGSEVPSMRPQSVQHQQLNNFWNYLIPALQLRCANRSPDTERLFVLGKPLGHFTAEYLILGLASLSLLLLVFSLIAILVVCRKSTQGSLHFHHK